jgi:hypothetical protein
MKSYALSRSQDFALVFFVASTLLAACDKPAGEGAAAGTTSTTKPSPDAKAASSAKDSASAAPAAALIAPAAAAPASGDPFAGAPADPGDEVPIPYAKGYVVVAPKGWKTEGHEKGGDTVLTPPSGKGTIVFAGSSGSALFLRVSQFLKSTTTAGEKWQPDTKTTLGVDGLSAIVTRGEGFRTLPKGQKEIHKVMRVQVTTDLKDLDYDADGKTLVTIQALAEWNADDPDFEKAAIEAIKGIKKKK